MNNLPQNLESEHWRFGSAVAVWVFDLPRLESETQQAAFKRHTLKLLDVLKPFAFVERFEWITESAGEDAAELRPDGDPSPQQIASTFERLLDVIEVSMWLDLACVSSTGLEFVVRQGANLYLEIVGDPGELRLQLRLSLDADIYSPYTHGEVRENEILATLNGPRLAGFLRGVRERMGGTIHGIVSSPSYEDLVSDEGSGFPRR